MLLAGLPAHSATLIYEAFLSGAPVGTAHLRITRTESSYRIAGTAAADGMAHLFSDWQSDFHAVGRFAGGLPVLLSYAYDERERRKRRVLELHDGVVRQVKNGQVRAAFPVLGGTDVLTAFFVDPGCWHERLVHTGRYSYRIHGRPSKTPGGCEFEVSDEDGGRTRVHVRFGTHADLRVPVLVSTRGLLRGSIRLRKHPPSVQLVRASPG
jgi:hypothetical protein